MILVTLKGGIAEHEQDYRFRNPGMKSGTGSEVHQGRVPRYHKKRELFLRDCDLRITVDYRERVVGAGVTDRPR